MVILLVTLTTVGILALSLHFLGAGYPRWAGQIGAGTGVGALIGLALILILWAESRSRRESGDGDVPV
jgi:uncharacterized membrane protein YccC